MQHINNARHLRDEQPIESDPLMQRTYTRRGLFKRAALLGVVGVGLLGVAACGGSDDSGEEASAQRPAEGQEDQLACAGSEELAPSAIAARKAVNYVDHAADPARICSGCHFFKAPEQSARCGGCQIIAGPIAPEGTCNAWVAGG